MTWLSDWSLWLILGFGLLIAELVVPGIFIMWWGFAAIIVAGIVAIGPELGVGLQTIVFALLAMIFSLIWWKFQHKKDQQEDQGNTLNARDHAMMGQKGVIVELLEGGIARGKFGDTTWRVEGAELAIHQKVEVIRVEGITLYVKVLEKAEKSVTSG